MARVLLLLLTIALINASPDWTDCQNPCHCIWSSGKKTAICKNGGFTTIPTNIDAEIQILDLTGNHIRFLSKDAFRHVGLINLQRIFMSKTGLIDINRDAFRDLIILIEIDLSHNKIGKLHPKTFSGNERLRVLYLSGNPITHLVQEQFPILPHLRILDFEGCKIESVHEDAFVYLSALESLNLKYNALANISETVFMNFANLKTLLLDGNPWNCDCHLRGFRNWFLSSNLVSMPLSCARPDFLKNKRWEEISSEEFACPPTVAVSPQNVVQAEAGGNVTFGCHIKGDPEPQVSWFFEGYPINHTWLILEAEEGILDKWANISIFNVSETDVGTYSCVARNVLDTVVRNVSLVLPEVVTATTVSKSEIGYVWWTVVVVGVAMSFSALCTMVAVCCVRSRNSKVGREMKASVSFTDQEKKLLDVSIATTTDRGTGSCEAIGPEDIIEQPVHITIEREPLPVAVYPPPPEFSGTLHPSGPFGNIFISVSLSRDHPLDTIRRPDLLDLPHRSKAVYHGMATLPRRPSAVPSHYDNMGPRITAGGSSTLSLPGSGVDELPPPPPPPSCVPLTPEFVSL